MKDLGATKNLVIVQKSKIDDWINHFKEFYDYKVFNLRKKEDLEIFLLTNEKSVGIINYELTFRREELLELKDFTLMLDESSYIKNEKAKRTKFIMKLQYENLILLSGTPIGGKYEELYSQMRMLGYKISKTSFYRQYIVTFKIDVGGFPINIVTGYKNVDRLKFKLREHGAVFMKTEDVIELPVQNDIKISVKRTPEYNRFRKDDYVKFKDLEFIGSNSLTKQLYERQLCSIYNSNKLTAFKEHLEGTSDRVIVFYNFTKEYEVMKEVVEKLDRPISVVNGKTRDLDNYENKSDSVTFVQYQAGAKGLNLQKANKIIYYSPTLSAELYMQSKKRIHRIGQDRPCFYYYLTTEGSIETDIYRSVEKGEDYTLELFEEVED